VLLPELEAVYEPDQPLRMISSFADCSPGTCQLMNDWRENR